MNKNKDIIDSTQKNKGSDPCFYLTDPGIEPGIPP